MEFIEAPVFTRWLSEYLNDEGYRELQAKLAANPDLGDVMPGTGGFRKSASALHADERALQERENSIMAKREIFTEMMEGVSAMKGHREGKLTLRSYKVDVTPLTKVDSKLLRDTRKKLRCSRAVFARKLRINERTLEKWEQGRAKPNAQAAALVLLVRKYPDTLARLDEVAGE